MSERLRGTKLAVLAAEEDSLPGKTNPRAPNVNKAANVQVGPLHLKRELDLPGLAPLAQV